MPRVSPFALIWSEVRGAYELFLYGRSEQLFPPENEDTWLVWLASKASFAFHGRSGRLNVYKEERGRGGRYWYAYRNDGSHTRKRYLGQTSNVTFARLEQIARLLNSSPAFAPHEADAAPISAPSRAERAASQRRPLLATRLSQPRLPSTLVERKRLFSLLEEAPRRRLTLLSASGGWGKTTLLAAWALLHPKRVVWLSLDELDNDPQRFWVSVIRAMQYSLVCPPTLGEFELAQLRSPRSASLTVLLAGLLDEIAACESEMVLILDDYHLITEQSIHDSLLFLLEHLPANLHLVLSSRVDPPWSLSRLRVRGQMLEIRSEDLRFTEEEAARFLRQTMTLPLSEAEAALLTRRTEGWVAGLQLAALAMSKHEAFSTFVHRFTGGHRYLLDYVQQDILAQQPEPLQTFLLRSSILSRLSASLCQAVTAEPNPQISQQMLEQVERANLFLIPLDEERHWYRLHDLFREALLARLRATQPESVPLLHLRAAHWYEAHAMLPETIAHALEAHDESYAADLLTRFITTQGWRGQYHTLRRWLARLSVDVLAARPDLSLQYAYATILTSPRGLHMANLVAVPLSMAEQGYRATNNLEGLGAVDAFRSILLGFQGDFERAFALARRALSQLSEEASLWRGHALSMLGIEALVAGQTSLGSQLGRQGLALYTLLGSLPGTQFANVMLGEAALIQGKLHEAAYTLRRVFAVPGEQPELSQSQLRWETGEREVYYECLARSGLAALAYEWNNLEEAEHLLQEAFAQGQQLWSHLLTPGLLLPVRLFVARAKMQQAHDFLHARVASEQHSGVQREIQFCQAWLALHGGDLVRVHQWASSRPNTRPYPLCRREEEELLLARLWLTEGQPDVALEVLVNWTREAHSETRQHSALQILVLESLALQASGAQAQARVTLLQACRLARVEGYQRLFLDEGERMETLLKTLLRELNDEALIAFTHTLLRAFAATRVAASAPSSANRSTLAEPLTPQEQRVLRQLARGASNQEIADQLVVSLPTAKKHVANILRKLEAQNRTQAVTLARVYGLI